MVLLLLLFLGIGVGILLTRSRYGKNINRAADQAGTTSRSWVERGTWWWRINRPGGQPPGFRAYATGQGAEHFPEDFRKWLTNLSDSESDRFTKSLADYSKSLGYHLAELIDGGLDDQPSLLNVFVEAIVIYSQEYRKALKTREEQAEEKAPVAGGKKSAQKRSSRRKAGAEGAL